MQMKTRRLPFIDTLQAVEALVRAGLAQEYWVYGTDDETYIALDSIGEVTVQDNKVQARWDGKIIALEVASDPFEQVGRLLGEMPIDNWRAFGYIAFDAAGFYYPYPLRASTLQIRFVIPRTELKLSQADTIISTTEDVEKIVANIQAGSAFDHVSPNAPALHFVDKGHYEHQVAELIKDIHAGQLSKAILARQVRLPGSIDIISTYDSIRVANPAARTYCFHQKELSGVGSSPELLMKTTKGGLILTNPLAGTRPRGGTKQSDEGLRKELLSDPKEIKEHEMSVKLAHEELLSVCKPGSVSIRDYMRVASFRTVQHLSSKISGSLKDGQTLWDGLRALFPGVTVSGIDKRSAIEKIAAYEGKARGLYGGCVGWVDSDGASDLALALRSAFEDDHGVVISAGAGIVAESIPGREYEETVHKMKTIHSQLVLR